MTNERQDAAEPDYIEIPADNPFNDESTLFSKSGGAAEPRGAVRQQGHYLKYKKFTIPMSKEEEREFENALLTYKDKYGTFFGFVGKKMNHEVH